MKKLPPIIFVCLLFFVACKDSKKEIDQIMKKEAPLPSEQAKTVEILYTDSGLVTMRVTAPVMNHFTQDVPEGFTEMPQGMYVEFFDDSGKVKSTLKADFAVRYEKSKRTEARKNVVVVNVNGEVLNTEKLNWDEANKKIYTDAFVKISTKKDVLRGTGMEANQDFTEYEIRNISGSTSAPGEEEKKEEKK